MGMAMHTLDRDTRTAQLLDDIEQISAAASHELRDQLREALLYCDELRRIAGTGGAPLVTHIEHCIASTMENVSALRQYAYLVQNSENPQSFALDDVLVRAKAKFHGSMLLHKGDITWNPATMPRVNGRPRQLELLFTHLFENGLKYNRSEKPLVEVTYAETPNFHEIEVRDNGIGMEPEYAFLVFGLFKRIEPLGPVKGCGAGLAYAKKIAENHDGVLTMETEA
ncbi:MAG: hypothetical protein FJX23_05115, partial [Alphaproteobacteria bacterium]|nr:hypothetical protein [Alphaproteobacteria bacterium]